MDLEQAIDRLRRSGGDTTSIEVKSAAGGLPESLTATLSAMANLPGGGSIILGLDEGNDFAPVGLADANRLRQGLASKARGYRPPVRLEFDDDAQVGGQSIVAARVLECDRSAKPCRVASTGKAYIRGYDGDYELSDLEMQAFLAQRSQPHFDRQALDDATIGDLDEDLVGSWIGTVRALAPSGLARFDVQEILMRGGVARTDGRPTKAGLLALGRYPQEWLPRFVIQAAVEPPADAERERARNLTTIAGPIPSMLEGAMEWARRSFDRTTLEAGDGTVVEQYRYPLEAFRELISNALVHRDLAPWSEGRAIEVRYSARRLVVTSPGGLWGITTDRLGLEGVSSARNAQLLSICQYVRSGEGEGRVVEALAQGLPRVHRLLQRVGSPPPRYVDRGISFTVILQAPPSTLEPTAPLRGDADLPPTQAAVFGTLGPDWISLADMVAMSGLQPANARRALRALRSRGLIDVTGGPGRKTFYRRGAPS